MQAQHLDHIGIKVGNIDGALPEYADLGFRLSNRRRFSEVGLEIAFLELGGQRFELLESLDGSSPIETDPMGLHHVAFRCGDLHRAYEEICANARYRVLGPPAPGAHGTLVFFFRVEDSNALIEMVGSALDDDPEPEVWRW